jgi:hypothetical protein
MSSTFLRLMAAVAGLALASACRPQCPSGETDISVCLECSLDHTCAAMGDICASPCNAQSDCTLPNQCVGGLCQPIPCT